MVRFQFQSFNVRFQTEMFISLECSEPEFPQTEKLRRQVKG